MERGLPLLSPGSSTLKEKCRKDYTGTVEGKVNAADSLSLAPLSLYSFSLKYTRFLFLSFFSSLPFLPLFLCWDAHTPLTACWKYCRSLFVWNWLPKHSSIRMFGKRLLVCKSLDSLNCFFNQLILFAHLQLRYNWFFVQELGLVITAFKLKMQIVKDGCSLQKTTDGNTGQVVL